jgi:uncharacterized protein YjbI with pentapeptide repeats
LSGEHSKQLVRLTQAQLDEVARRHAMFRESRSGGRRAVLAGYDLSGLCLADGDLSHSDCTGSSFLGADLRRSRFDSATLFACDFRHANLENASFMRADLRGCFFAEAMMAGANLFEADLRPGMQISRDKSGEFHVMKPQECGGVAATTGFTGANLTNASLAGVVAVQTDFSEALMRGCKLVRAHIRGANFTGTNLEGADFAQADMRGACFRGAVLSGVNFDYTDMAGADLRDVLSDQPSGRLLGELNTSLEELLRLHRTFIESCGASGTALDLSGFDLRSAGALAGACLTMLTASHAVFYGLDLSYTALQAAHCANADFRECRFDGADMRGIQLAGATLNGASMRGVKLCALVMGDKRRMQSDLSGASLRHADMRGADLRGVRLAGVDLSDADLTDADVSDAFLGDAKLSGCKVSREQLNSTLKT